MQFTLASLPRVPSASSNTASTTLVRIIAAGTAGDEAYCLCRRRILGRYLMTRQAIVQSFQYISEIIPIRLTVCVADALRPS